MRDLKEVINGLEVCVSRAPGGDYICYKCPYEIDGNDCEINSIKDAIALLKEQESVIETLKSDLKETLAVLGEQPEIVRCRDCKYWSAERINDFNKCRRWIKVGVKNFATMGDWFCADGKRR